MEKEKFHHGNASFLPPSGRYPVFPPPTGSSDVQSESMGSLNFPPLVPGSSPEQGHFCLGMPSESGRFSQDLRQMPDNPPKNLGHRRAHSEILTLPDDITFDSDLGIVGGLDGPSLSDETEEDLLLMYLDMDKFNSTSAISEFQMSESSRVAPALAVNFVSTSNTDNLVPSPSERPRIQHQHSQSMDGSTTIKSEMLVSGPDDMSPAESKKSLSAAKLSELALLDPKRAKRIWANRQSASRSKVRKMRYIAELERKVQTLQTEATTLSAQLSLLQRDTNGLTVENSELKLRLQTKEQQVHLQDALNDALKEEIQHLKVLTCQPIPNDGHLMNFPISNYGSNKQYYSNNHAVHTLLTTQQLQQLQINSQTPQNQIQQHQLHLFQQQSQSSIQQQEHQSQQAEDLKLPLPMQKDMIPDATSKD